MKELAIGYCRVSTKEQEKKGFSLDAQEDIINSHGENNGCKLVHIFKIQESGSKVERKKLFRAFQFCVENNVKLILISDSDRWTRNRRLDMDAIDYLKKHGMRVYLIQDRRTIPHLEGASALAFQHDIKVTTDAYFIAQLRERILRGIKKKLEKGEFPSTPPLGYRSIKKTDDSPQRIIQTEKAPKVKELLRLFNAGKYSVRQMIRLAKDIGLKPKKKSEFTKGAMAKLIKNRFYYGEFEYSIPTIDDGKSKIYKNQGAGFKPIITKKMWEQNQAILKKHQTNHKGRNKNQHLFNNMMTCGKCGGLVFGFKPDYKVKWKTKNGVQAKTYSYKTHYICNKNSYYTTDGKNAVWKDYVDKENLIIKDDITYEDDRTGEKKIRIKKGTAVEMRRCDMPYFLESEVEDMLMDEIGLIKFNKKMWEKAKKDLFADETKEFLDYEICALSSEKTKNETRLKELYNDWKEEKIDFEFYDTSFKETRERQQEVKERLLELEEDREMYHEKTGRAIEILDSFKNWEAIWKKVDAEKKKHILNLMTIKISTTYMKKEYRDKTYESKRLHITYQPEIEELFNLGLLEYTSKNTPPPERLWPIFNSPKFRYSRSDH